MNTKRNSNLHLVLQTKIAKYIYIVKGSFVLSREDVIKRINLNDFDYLLEHLQSLGMLYNSKEVIMNKYSVLHNNIDCVIEDIYLKYLNRAVLFTVPQQSKQLLISLRKIINFQLTLKTQDLDCRDVIKLVDDIIIQVDKTKKLYSDLL